MNHQFTQREPICHRCNGRTVLHSQQTVGDKPMHIFRCEACNQFQAIPQDTAA